LLRLIPDFHEHKRVLNIGASGKQHFMIPEMLEAGQHVSVVEIYEPYVLQLRKKFPQVAVYHANVLDIATLRLPKFDLIFWWHGPEHHPAVAPVLCLLYTMEPHLLVVSTPNGRYPQAAIDGNPRQEHRHSFEPGYWKRLGFEEWSSGIPGDMRGNIVAWRRWE
jgi:hypothetical protein